MMPARSDSIHWDTMIALLGEALELPLEAREAFVTRRCAGDLELRDELLSIVTSPAEPSFLAPDPALLSTGLGGMQLGDFELGDELGRGAAGVVYRGHQKSRNRDVAVKVLRPGLASDAPRQTEQLRQEAEALSQVRHPALVRMVSYGEQHGLHYLAMELVEGANLAQWLELHGPPRDSGSVRRVVDWMGEVADAVHTLHSSGIVHRDIKPQNILIDHGRRVHVVDLGIALRLGSEVGPEASSGTPGYMSPEQHSSKDFVADARTDVYACGVVLFEALAGRRPYQGATPLAVKCEIARGAPPALSEFNPSVTTDLNDVVRRALSVSRGERHPTLADLASDLRRWLGPSKSEGVR